KGRHHSPFEYRVPPSRLDRFASQGHKCQFDVQFPSSSYRNRSGFLHFFPLFPTNEPSLFPYRIEFHRPKFFESREAMKERRPILFGLSASSKFQRSLSSNQIRGRLLRGKYLKTILPSPFAAKLP